MSLCLCLQKPNEIYISGDSRVSVQINNQKYRWYDNYPKVHQIDNMVIFTGGQSQIMETIINEFKQSSIRNLDVLRFIAKKQFNKNYLYNNTNDMIVSMLIASFQEKPMVYFIGDRNNFEIMNIELNGREYQDILLGCECEKAREIFNYSNFSSEKFDDVFYAYKSLYEYVVNEQVGGKLTVYRLTKDAIEKKSCSLTDPNNIKQYQSYLTCKNLYIVFGK